MTSKNEKLRKKKGRIDLSFDVFEEDGMVKNVDVDLEKALKVKTPGVDFTNVFRAHFWRAKQNVTRKNTFV